MFNPFPGLRPFERDEDHLFFGREKEIDDLLRRLRSTRFLSVVGTSGSGKSSLVRSGLIPSLHSGFMAAAGSSWRIATLRPGEDPVGYLAAAINAPDVLGTEGELADTHQMLIEATLRRGSRGLVDSVRQARIGPDDNVLIVVDQFEELFRFRRSRQIENSRDEAVVFVKLLIEATRQTDVPIYVVLTMRSDFIGDCMDYPGLPEAVNAGQYLVPRMTRDELRSAITGPVAVGGGAMAPRLVLRMLNDLGDDPDQLPILQHALMRTWDHWERHRQSSEPIDIVDYQAIGTLQDALSLHAEEAYMDNASDRSRQIAEHTFKALTDTFSDQRGVRRPTCVRDIAEICGATEAEVIDVIEVFRQPGRSFLMPPPSVPLTSRSIIDLSHESLMRCWARLITWAEEDRAAAAFYARLSHAATWFEEGSAGLWRNPELELALRWRRDDEPTAAWARRYGGSFEQAMEFLNRSEQEQARLEAERERERSARLKRAEWGAGVLAAFLVIAASSAYVAWRENARAEKNLTFAREAVDETLSSADRDPARVGGDVPQMEEFRRELLKKAERFYLAFMEQQPRNEDVRRELAFAHFRIGHIGRLLEQPEQAMKGYQDAIAGFESLAKRSPLRLEYRQALANAENWLGETLRPMPGRASDAEKAYDRALSLQRLLLQSDARNAQYQEELARTLYNRGILRANAARSDEAESDFREAIRLLEPLTETIANAQPAQELARVYNNLASLLVDSDQRAAEVKALYERAIQIHERLIAKEPANREYKLELAKFCDNLADLSRVQGQFDVAAQRNSQALSLIDELARPAPSLSIEQADAHSLRGLILVPRAPHEAAREYQTSFDIFATLAQHPELHPVSEFHLRFGDLLVNLAALAKDHSDVKGGRRLFAQAAALYAELANKMLKSGSLADAQSVLDNVSRVLPELPGSDQTTASYRELEQKLRAMGARR